MSNWTHVAAIIRVDSIRFDNEVKDFTKIFGRECLFESSEEVWDDAYRYPNKYLPMGSEGSLKMSVWVNPDPGCLAAYTVSIFGDLRDHDDPQAIIDWLEKKIRDNNVSIRNACATVENELNGTVNWVYKES
jgi:hypothetical protein